MKISLQCGHVVAHVENVDTEHCTLTAMPFNAATWLPTWRTYAVIDDEKMSAEDLQGGHVVAHVENLRRHRRRKDVGRGPSMRPRGCPRGELVGEPTGERSEHPSM